MDITQHENYKLMEKILTPKCPPSAPVIRGFETMTMREKIKNYERLKNLSPEKLNKYTNNFVKSMGPILERINKINEDKKHGRSYSIMYLTSRCMDVVNECDKTINYHIVCAKDKESVSQRQVLQAWERLKRSCTELAEEIFLGCVFPSKADKFLPYYFDKPGFYDERVRNFSEAEHKVLIGKNHLRYHEFTKDTSSLDSCRRSLQHALAYIHKAQIISK